MPLLPPFSREGGGVRPYPLVASVTQSTVTTATITAATVSTATITAAADTYLIDMGVDRSTAPCPPPPRPTTERNLETWPRMANRAWVKNPFAYTSQEARCLKGMVQARTNTSLASLPIAMSKHQCLERNQYANRANKNSPSASCKRQSSVTVTLHGRSCKVATLFRGPVQPSRVTLRYHRSVDSCGTPLTFTVRLRTNGTAVACPHGQW